MAPVRGGQGRRGVCRPEGVEAHRVSARPAVPQLRGLHHPEGREQRDEHDLDPQHEGRRAGEEAQADRDAQRDEHADGDAAVREHEATARRWHRALPHGLLDVAGVEPDDAHDRQEHRDGGRTVAVGQEAGTVDEEPDDAGAEHGDRQGDAPAVGRG